MSHGRGEVRQRKKMVPHASLPHKPASPTTLSAGTVAGKHNAAFHVMGLESPELTPDGPASTTTLLGVGDVIMSDVIPDGNAPKLKNGAASTDALELELVNSNFDEEETSLTAPLLPDDQTPDAGSDNNNERQREKEQPPPEVLTSSEASWQVALQVFFPYIIAGLGMVAAGIVLDIVQVRLDHHTVSFHFQTIWGLLVSPTCASEFRFPVGSFQR